MRSEPGGYSKLPWYALRENYLRRRSPRRAACRWRCRTSPNWPSDYLDADRRAGGHRRRLRRRPGALRRRRRGTPRSRSRSGRTGFELAVHQGALDRDMPVLGHLRRPAAAERRARRHADPAHPRQVRGRAGARAAEPAHRARPRRRGRAGHAAAPHRRRRAGCAVNSAHHQAVDHAGPAPWSTRRRPDGVIEGDRGPAPPLLPRRPVASGIRRSDPGDPADLRRPSSPACRHGMSLTTTTSSSSAEPDAGRARRAHRQVAGPRRPVLAAATPRR